MSIGTHRQKHGHMPLTSVRHRKAAKSEPGGGGAAESRPGEAAKSGLGGIWKGERSPGSGPGGPLSPGPERPLSGLGGLTRTAKYLGIRARTGR